MDDKYNRFISLLADKFGVDPDSIEPSARLRGELNADPLDVMEIVISLERLFAVEIPQEAINKKLTVGELATLCGAEPGGLQFE